MSDVLTPASEADLNVFVAEQIRPIIVRALEAAGTGQRLRVTSLPTAVMEKVCQDLQGENRWQARILNDGTSSEDWRASATKLIELRNTLSEPLIVFIPQGLRNAAEDSLDIATFTELSLKSVAPQLVEVLLGKLERPLQDNVREVLGRLRQEKVIRHTDEEVQYLLDVWKNGASTYAAGGALYCFGLIPDFEIFERGSHLQWLSRNHVICGFLEDVTQPLQSRLARLRLKPQSIQSDLFKYIRSRQSEDVRSWARGIACDSTLRNLAFEFWQFSDAPLDQELRLILEPLTLPVQADDAVSGAAQLPILNLNGKDPLKVAFRSIPKPAQFPSWKHFRVQILALIDESPSIVWESNNFPRTQGPAARITRSIKVVDLQALDEGTYYVRVEAYDADGALLNGSPRLIDPSDPSSRAENESERFLVLREDVVTTPDDTRSVYVPSILDAWMRVALKNLGAKSKDTVPSRRSVHGSWDEPAGAAPRSDVYFELETEGFAGFAVAVPSLLRKIELLLLRNPDQIGRHQLALTNVRSASDIQLKYESTPLSSLELGKEFLLTRQEIFLAIERDHLGEGADAAEFARRAGTLETVDITKYRALIEKYVHSYINLSNALLLTKSGEADALILSALDTIELRWQRSVGDPGRALIISPTHPLRMAWHLAHADLCDSAVSAWQDGTHAVPSWRKYIEQIQGGLIPLNMPMVLFDRRGRGYVEQTPITAYWPLYLPDQASGDVQLDTVAVRDRILSAMGIGQRSVVLTTVGVDEVANRLFEYLEFHPYVEQLRLNVFNPGDGRFIADVLRSLERRRISVDARDAPSLRYAVHLFAAPPYLDMVAEGLEALLDPDRQVGQDDEFTLGSSNHLLPKLVFARNSTEEFLQSPELFSAHVSILHEQFIAHSRVGHAENFRRGSFVGGLINEPDVLVESSGSQFGWTKGLRPHTHSADKTSLLTEALHQAQRLQTAAALGQKPGNNVVPVVALQLDANAQMLLKRSHDHSDWVITIDRNLGLDYFDTPTSGDEAGYLLDFAPEYLLEDRQRLLLTTRNSIELQSLIKPALERVELILQPNEEVVVLEALRSLSGRLALRFEAGRAQAAEVIGLLLARWLLEHVGVLNDRIVIPLDAHRKWFANDGEEVQSQRRADLLLVGFEKGHTLRLDIVEVKLRDDLPMAARSRLYSDMHEQVENTHQRLRDLFDPDRFTQPRADFALRAKELATTLTFYTRRANRYGLLSTDACARALSVIDKLDSGYSLDVRLVGVVFEKTGKGAHEEEDEPGFRIYRFGGDMAQKLLSFAVGRRSQRISRLSDVSFEGQSNNRLLRQAPEREVIEPELDAFGLAVATLPENVVSDKELVEESVDATDVALAGTIFGGTVEAVAETITEATDTVPPIQSEAVTDRSQTIQQSAPDAQGAPDITLGSAESSPQFGILGRSGEQTVAIDLNGCNTISLFGVQGFGKSYTLGVIAEMATTKADGINLLPSPLATVIFHYHKSDAYEPEHASAVYPNEKKSEIDRLLAEYGAVPKGLENVVLLTPEAKVEQRRREHPDLTVEAIKFSSSELGAESWKFLLGAYGNDSLYVRQLVAIMRKHRSDLTLDVFRAEIEAAEMPKSARQLAEDRIRLAAPYIDDAKRLGSLLKPGRTIIIDLRDEWIEKDEALGLFVVMLKIFAAQKHEKREFNKLVVFDEAHKYMSESALIGQVVETIREMRHQATSVVIASQDPLSVPRAVIELTSILVLHRITSPQWLKHLKGAIGALEELTESQVASLKPGEALIWAQRSTDSRYTLRPQKLRIRPRFTRHGGGTRTAVQGFTMR